MRVEENETEEVIRWLQDALLKMDSETGIRESMQLLLDRFEVEDSQQVLADLSILVHPSAECQRIIARLASCGTAHVLFGLLAVTAGWRLETDHVVAEGTRPALAKLGDGVPERKRDG